MPELAFPEEEDIKEKWKATFPRPPSQMEAPSGCSYKPEYESEDHPQAGRGHTSEPSFPPINLLLVNCHHLSGLILFL